MSLHTGWGLTNGLDKNSFAHVLQKAPLTISGFWNCLLVNSQLSLEVDEETMLCAGEDGKGGCRGDSGGPLACNERGQWVLRGIVSWGHADCNADDYYTVFARVSSLIDWIENTTKESEVLKGLSIQGVHGKCN